MYNYRRLLIIVECTSLYYASVFVCGMYMTPSNNGRFIVLYYYVRIIISYTYNTNQSFLQCAPFIKK